jgi:hypothetical protein
VIVLQQHATPPSVTHPKAQHPQKRSAAARSFHHKAEALPQRGPKPHEPRRETSPRRSHLKMNRPPRRSLAASPPCLEPPVRAQGTGKPKETHAATTHHAPPTGVAPSRKCSRATLKELAEARPCRQCVETQQAAFPHTSGHWSRCPSAAEAASGHESLARTSRRRSELSASAATEAAEDSSAARHITRGDEPGHRPRDVATAQQANRRRKPKHRDGTLETQPEGSATSQLALEGIEDTFPRFLAFQRSQTGESLNVTACLTATFRSQGFSPSQRFGPHLPLRLCFTPHPLIGFGPSELSHRSGQRSLATSHTHLPFEATLRCTVSGRGNTTHQPNNVAHPLGARRPTLRTTEPAVRSRCSPGLHLSEAYQHAGWPRGASPHALGPRNTPAVARRNAPAPCTTGYSTKRIWTLLPKE